ncbi:MAG: RluA family pseudouridine synthase [Treponema sp.]|jgi:23S rRNA pseudouridine955/2504/2580 synthase|nr:RluA family pseudouridine synthase [Treponema sp.]
MAITLTAAADDNGRRLDRILRKALPDMPLSAIHSLLRKGRVLVDGVPENGACRVRSGSAIQIPLGRGDAVSVVPAEKQETPNRAPNWDLPKLHILWEDADFLILNKPAGLAVHGSDRGSGNSLETLARAYLAPKLPPSLSFKPGPLHRLDRPTSGIIVFSKSLEGARGFRSLLREKRVRKTYLALLEGILDRDETWEDILIRDRDLGKSFVSPGPASGEAPREARTRVRPLARNAAASAAGVTLARLEPDTGRTHQIRVQAAAHGHPLAGDRKYGGAAQGGGFLLHAHSLELPGQTLPGLPRRLEAPLPDYFRKRIEELFGVPPWAPDGFTGTH